MADIIKVKEVSKISEKKRYDAAFKKEIAQVYQSAKILHHKICELLGGEEKMENINRLFHQRFLLTTPIVGYLQGADNRDRETSRMVFQLLLDDIN